MVFSRSCKLLVLYHSQARYFINIHEPPIRYLARRCQASYLINQDLPLSGFYAVNMRLRYSWVALISKLDDLLIGDCISYDASVHLSHDILYLWRCELGSRSTDQLSSFVCRL